MNLISESDAMIISKKVLQIIKGTEDIKSIKIIK